MDNMQKIVFLMHFIILQQYKRQDVLISLDKIQGRVSETNAKIRMKGKIQIKIHPKIVEKMHRLQHSKHTWNAYFFRLKRRK
ncbi:hypothetical protein COM46_17230 [Bacillus pseudomycoides]|nr:hypothetical protein COM46_17230 [Bacillus pseudomycoides]